MPYLDTYSTVLSETAAAHLLRRATFGPTRQEILDFTGLTATQAVDRLIADATLTLTPPAPVDYDETQPTAGQQFLNKPYSRPRSTTYNLYLRYWWIGSMLEQNGRPSVLEKLSLFWQNHFSVSQAFVNDYRMMDTYLRLLRTNCLGNFRTIATEITKDAAMLLFQNGNENEKGKPNENYARELQELFIVGAKDFYGNPNYTEEDVKAASKVLTGWQVTNYFYDGSPPVVVVFTPTRHDSSDKTFSPKYNNRVITGRLGEDSGTVELNDLIDMLLKHPNSPKHICRKLYRWYVHPEINQDIESNVIGPLATFFASAENNFRIAPVLKKLLTSDIFFDSATRGALIKSPAEWIIGMLRFFNHPVPNRTTDYIAFRKLTKFAHDHMSTTLLPVLDPPTVFGYVPYYQTGYSQNWINGTTIGYRISISDFMLTPSLEIKPGYKIGVDWLARAVALQPNFSDVQGTPGITCEQVLEDFTRNLFAIELTQAQKDFLIDTIMMKGLSRSSWVSRWNLYRSYPDDPDRKAEVQNKCIGLMRYVLRMAELHVF